MSFRWYVVLIAAAFCIMSPQVSASEVHERSYSSHEVLTGISRRGTATIQPPSQLGKPQLQADEDSLAETLSGVWTWRILENDEGAKNGLSPNHSGLFNLRQVGETVEGLSVVVLPAKGIPENLVDGLQSMKLQGKIATDDSGKVLLEFTVQDEKGSPTGWSTALVETGAGLMSGTTREELLENGVLTEIKYNWTARKIRPRL